MGINLIPLTCLKMPNRTLEVLKIQSFANSCRNQGSWDEDGQPGMEADGAWKIFFASIRLKDGS